MVLETVYEGLIAGTKNVDPTALTDATEIVAGRICTLEKGGTKDPGVVYFAGLTNSTDTPFGLNADYKDDVIANGKCSVYFTPGLYLTDQTSGAIAKGDVLSFTATGLLAKAVTADYIVGICTEAAGSDGFIELYLNITGSVSL